jgi:hypothetical protein
MKEEAVSKKKEDTTVKNQEIFIPLLELRLSCNIGLFSVS